jgi:hypothetical protein
MVNPAVMQQLAGERRREDLERVRIGGAGLQLAHRSVRERLGWSLVGLGARLAREPLTSGTGYANHARGGQRVRARSVLPFARM